MNNLSLLTTIAGLGTIASAAAHSPSAKQSQPNILIIYTDDMGIGDLSCTNNGWITTPNIDRLAKQGLVMNQYYSSAPVSSPSRVGLTTGLFPLEMGINTYLHNRKGNAACEQSDFLDAAAPSMARVFKQAGYKTAHFGKWHMGGGRDVTDAPRITQYGFDEYCSTWESPDPAPELTASDWIWSPKDDVKRWNRTAYFVDKTIEFMARHRGEPCFINLWPDDMHTPWVPDEESQDKHKKLKPQVSFAAVLTEYDKQIGRLIDRLDSLGMTENTIIIFTSDNGPAPSFNQMRANDMRGVKNSLYEGGINMPFIISWQGVIKPAAKDNTTVICAVDLLPSLCRIVGAKLPKEHLDGEDMSTALLGKPTLRKGDLMWDFGRNNAFSFPSDKYHRSPSLAIRRGDWKLLIDADGTGAELYNIVKDPKETTNVASENSKIVSEMTKKLLKWWDARPRVGDAKMQ